jgi:phage-related protein (TIGR01555 family)
MLSLMEKAIERVDGWINTMTQVGVGVGRTNFTPDVPLIFHDSILESLYVGDAYANRIARVVPEEATRRGFSFRTGTLAGGGGSQDQDEKLLMAWDALHLTQKYTEAWVWGRVFGGGAVFFGIDDGRPPEAPVNWANIRAITFATVLEKREMMVAAYYDDPARPGFGEPSLYDIVRISGGVASETLRVHASRLIRFEGSMTSRLRRIQNQGWGESELARVYSSLQQFNGAYAAVANLLQDASQGVFVMENLFQMMLGDKLDTIKKRLAMMDLTRGSARMIAIDKEKEDFKRVEVSGLGGGLPATIDKFMYLLAGAAEIPVTVLMGQAPAGENATGNNDIRWFYDRTDSARTQYLAPRVVRGARLLCAAKNGPTNGYIPAKLRAVFPSMYQSTPTEEADMRLKTAQADSAYIDKGVLKADEVAKSRDLGVVIDPNVPRGAGSDEHAALKTEHAALKASNTGTRNMLQHAMKRLQEHGITGSPLMRQVAATSQAVDNATGGDSPTPTAPDIVADSRAFVREALRFDGSGVAIVLPVPPVAASTMRIATGAIDPDPHCTLLFLGQSGSLTPDALTIIRAVLRSWAPRQFAIPFRFSGVGRFQGGDRDPVYLSPSGPDLARARESLVQALEAVGVYATSGHGWIPHITLAYVPAGSAMPDVAAGGEAFTFDRVELWNGEAHEAFSFAGSDLPSAGTPLSLAGAVDSR